MCDVRLFFLFGLAFVFLVFLVFSRFFLIFPGVFEVRCAYTYVHRGMLSAYTYVHRGMI